MRYFSIDTCAAAPMCVLSSHLQATYSPHLYTPLCLTLLVICFPFLYICIITMSPACRSPAEKRSLQSAHRAIINQISHSASYAKHQHITTHRALGQGLCCDLPLSGCSSSRQSAASTITSPKRNDDDSYLNRSFIPAIELDRTLHSAMM